MRIVCLAAALLLAACGQTPARVAGRPSSSPSPTSAFTPAASSPPSGSPTPAAPTPSPLPAPQVSCLAGVIPAFQALITGTNGTFLYDVTDPRHPHAACRIANTVARVVTGTAFEYLVPRPDGTTSVVLHALGSNNETTRATFQADLYHVYYGWQSSVTWLPGKDRLAYLAGGGTDASGLGLTDVWLATATGRTRMYSYAVPGKDAFGRPGFAPWTLGFSPDGQYLAAGWSVAVATPLRVFRLSDMANVTPQLPADFRFAFWSRSGLTLYLVSGNAVEEWTPGGGLAQLPNTPSWILDPNLSPNGTQVAFTSVSSTREVRATVYDLTSQTNRLLTEQPRSSALFVKGGWVWEVEEKPCLASSSQACFDPTVPDGNVLAVDLGTRTETAITFAAGETPTSFGLVLGDLWPKT